MTAVSALQFKPNPTSKRRIPRQTKCQRKFSSEQALSVQGQQGNESARFSFMPPTLPFSTSTMQKHKKVKLFPGEFREFSNYLITGLQSSQLQDLNSGGKYLSKGNSSSDYRYSSPSLPFSLAVLYRFTIARSSIHSSSQPCSQFRELKKAQCIA